LGLGAEVGPQQGLHRGHQDVREVLSLELNRAVQDDQRLLVCLDHDDAQQLHLLVVGQVHGLDVGADVVLALVERVEQVGVRAERLGLVDGVQVRVPQVLQFEFDQRDRTDFVDDQALLGVPCECFVVGGQHHVQEFSFILFMDRHIRNIGCVVVEVVVV